MKKTFYLSLIASVITAFSAVNAQEVTPAPEMTMPIDCEVGWNCWIANYVDHDRAKGFKDYACGDQSYNTHKGTDFMIRNYRDMQGGISVRAAADGQVVGVRDGMKDIDFRRQPKERIAKKECGNGVRIDHGNGWVTQYCHMRKNSVKPAKGDRVKMGDIIGFVGNSGQSMFPHLHFQVEYISQEAKQRRGAIVDPFVGVSRNHECEAGRHALWPNHILEDLEYKTVDVFDAGFAATTPKSEGLIKGLYDDETLSVRSPALYLWGRFLHVKEGDKVTFQMKAPDGDMILDYTSTINKSQAYRSLHAGVRRPSISWDKGIYHGYIKLVRDVKGETRVFRTEATISLR